MASKDDFASFMQSDDAEPVKRLRRGDVVEGPVVLISKDSVFISLGGRSDGRIPSPELLNRDGSLRVSVGESIKATVVDPNSEGGPLLAVTMGRDQKLDVEALELAMESGTPIEGSVSRAVKAGLEVDMNGVRAFCPASQVDLGFVSELDSFVGQTLRFLVLEVKEGGRSVILSRRKVLEAERAERAASARERLQVGDILDGRVSSIQRYGAFVDLDGVEGLVHISELAARHVDRVEDVVNPGETIQVKVLSIEEGEKGPRIKLSMKALQASEETEQAAMSRDEVLEATVLRVLGGGVIVQTKKGEGLVPVRELGIPAGADHRRTFQVDQKLEVALLDEAGGRRRFSVQRVEEVLERTAYRNYKKGRASDEAASDSAGSLASQLGKLQLGKLPPGPPPAPPKPPAPKPAPPKPAPTKPTPAAQVAPAAQVPPAAPSTPTTMAEAAEMDPAGTSSGETDADATAPATPPKKRRRIVGPR